MEKEKKLQISKIENGDVKETAEELKIKAEGNDGNVHKD